MWKQVATSLINPLGVFVGDPSMGNMEAFDGYQKVKMFGMRNVETPRRKPTPPKEIQHTRRFWTIDEHMLVIC